MPGMAESSIPDGESMFESFLPVNRESMAESSISIPNVEIMVGSFKLGGMGFRSKKNKGEESAEAPVRVRAPMGMERAPT